MLRLLIMTNLTEIERAPGHFVRVNLMDSEKASESAAVRPGRFSRPETGDVGTSTTTRPGFTIVSRPSEGRYYSATLIFEWPEKFTLSAKSVAFIRLKSDRGPFEFVKMDHVDEIVGDHWGSLGMAVLEVALELLTHASANETNFSVGSAKVASLQLHPLPTGMSVDAYTTPTEWNSLLSCLKWLFSCLSHDPPSALMIRQFVPAIAIAGESQLSEFVVQEETISASRATANDACWLGLIAGANIGLYDQNPPTGSSAHDWVGKGLKIPFHILVQIASIDEIVDFDGTPVLCGFQTALIPIEAFDDGSVQWHFLTGCDDERFRWISDRHDFLQLLPPERLRDVDINNLKGMAYVGGWASITTILSNNASESYSPIMSSSDEGPI